MQIEIKKLVPEASIPQKATTFDTGYDLIALDDGKIVGEPINEKTNYWKRIDYIEYKTGIQIAPQSENDGRHLRDNIFENGKNIYYYTLVFPRSSISKYNLVLANSVGLIDNQYRGEILLRFKYIWQPEDYVFEGPSVFDEQKSFMFASPNLSKIYKRGDKIGQIAAFELNFIQWKEVKELNETQRSINGFGSSGK